MSEIGNSIIKSINTILNERLKDLKFDKTFHTTVLEKDGDGFYTVHYLGQPYKIYNALGTDLAVGQTVWVKIPGGIFRNMHICGIYMKKKHR